MQFGFGPIISEFKSNNPSKKGVISNKKLMGLTWKEEHLDYILVPGGLLIMLGYHLLHLRKCLSCPEDTAIGYENYNKRAWVKRILQMEAKERGQAITVISSNTSAATSLSSISLTLSSLIGAWIGSSYQNDYISNTIYGNTTPTIVYIKYVSLLACFLIAFACFVQTVRCFVLANFLISMPNCEMPVQDVESAVIKGSNFWVVGLRSLYLATNLLLWIFGPVPMFISSVATVALLQYVDKNAMPLPQYNDIKNRSINKSPVKSDKEMKEIAAKSSPKGTEPESSPNGISNLE